MPKKPLGNNTYVDLSRGAHADLMQVVGPITMEAWVQPTIPQNLNSGSGGEYGLILSKGYDLNEDVDNIDLDIRSDDNEKSYVYWGGVYSPRFIGHGSWQSDGRCVGEILAWL